MLRGQRDYRAETAESATKGSSMDTYNVYMDETPAGSDLDGDGGFEVEFRVVPNSADDGNPEANAVLAGLDLVDLINLRDAIQAEIDNYALMALEEAAGLEEIEIAEAEDELLP
jgi:hypothetical protein